MRGLDLANRLVDEDKHAALILDIEKERARLAQQGPQVSAAKICTQSTTGRAGTRTARPTPARPASAYAR